MKFFFFAILMSTTALASERSIVDLMYLPAAGTFYGQSQASLLDGRIKDSNDKTKIEGSEFKQQLGYAFTDSFLLNATLRYSDLSLRTPGSSDSKTSIGFADPVLNGRFRLNNEGIVLDFLAAYTFFSGNSHSYNGHGDAKGNNDYSLLGGPSASLGLQLGQSVSGIQWAVSALAIKTFQKTSEFEYGDVKYDSYLSYFLEAAALFEINAKLSLKTSLSSLFGSSYDSNQTPPQTTPSVSDYRLGAVLQVKSSDDLLPYFGAEFRKIVTNTGIIDDHHVWSLIAGARYQF